ncbi:uncharacterized protein LOC121367701 [Gigantopelta aegis]|uniref:uncharacterized protein LOC121367701 n=1 Tax=Gigantopelta aegis TaxID=1735272 RepID=UPI001B88D0BA|nr:uncharacterized protein LOC121367701 [Gigantopelta aegis]
MFNFYDYVRLFVFVIATYILATRKAKIWVVADLLFSVSLGVWMLIGKPSPAGLFSSKLDPFHVYLIQSVGCYVMISALFWFQSHKTRDYNVMKAIMLNRTMAVGMFTFLDVINCYRFPKLFTSLHYNTLCFGVLWLLGSAYQLIRHGLPTLRHEYKMSINWFLKADLGITAFVGLCSLLLPSYLLSLQSMKTNDLHEHFCQLFGACLMASSILSYMALGFRDSADKKAVLISRAMVNVLILLCYICGCMFRGITFTTRDVLLDSLIVPFILAPTLGVYIHRDRRTSVSGDGYYLRSRDD